jgi:hypothetical protein
MQIIRRYKKLDWWSFVEHIDLALDKDETTQESYIELLDEIRMRLLESVSEGASYKFKKQAQRLLTSYRSKFARSEDLAEIIELEEFFI